MSRRTPLFAAVFAALLLGAGCSSSSDSSSPDVSAPTDPTPTDPPPTDPTPTDPPPTDPTPTDPPPTDPPPTDPPPTDPPPTDPPPTDPTPTDPTPTDPPPTDPPPTDPTPTDPTPTDPPPTDPPPTDPPPMTGTSGDCLNRALLTAGTVYELDYRVNSEPSFDSRSQVTVNGPAVFQGVDSLQLDQTITSQGTTTMGQFFVLFDEQREGLVGSILTTQTMGFSSTVTTSRTPVSFIRRFDLAPGQTVSGQYTSRVDTDLSIPNVPETSIESEVSFTNTFFGIESVTVPAGTFQACRWDDSETVTTAPGASETFVSSQWIAVGSGVPLQTSDEGGVFTVLVRGSINGVAIMP